VSEETRSPPRKKKKPARTPRGEGGTERPSRSLLALAILGFLVLLVMLTAMFPKGGDPIDEIEFRKRLAKNEVEEITFRGDTLALIKLAPGELKDPTQSRERTITYTSIHDLETAKAEILKTIEQSQKPLPDGSPAKAPITTKVKPPEPQSQIPQVLMYLLFLVVPVGVIYWLFVRQMRGQGGPGNVLSFGKSRHRVASRDKTGVTLDDVAGADEAKEEVKEIIEFLRNPKKFSRLGGRIPKGVLLIGAPGTGKTLLAKAAAGEADVPFFSVCGSDFVEMFVGVGASRVRDLFEKAKENSPCIVFLDEVDAVGRRRGSGLGGGHDEREQTLNQILVEMDGFDTDKGIIVVAATNRPDILDPALLRPGRFDRQIVLDLPDVKGREQILQVHAARVKLGTDVDLRRLAQATTGFSGAELEAVVNEAALRAALHDRDAITREDLDESRDKVRWGRQKKSRVILEEDRRATAYHEAGHALVAAKHEGAQLLHKVTIIPRGAAAGATMFMPHKDEISLKKKQALAQMATLYGGRLGELIATDDLSTGASNDIEQATNIARRMVCEWGFSDELGPINYTQEQDTVFLGREITRTQNHSEATAKKIDDEVKKIIESSYERANDLIKKHRDGLDRLAEALLRFETITGEEVMVLLDGKLPIDLRRDEPVARPAREPAEAEPESEDERRPELGSGPQPAGAMA
jgi:cell division protease FtsH